MASLLTHKYGPNVHILDEAFLSTKLARLCAERTKQPEIGELVESIYETLLPIVVNREFPVKQAEIPTRMIAMHPEGVYRGPIVDPETPVVSVNLARAGTLPSQVCYRELNHLMNPERVRQDHISIARTTDAQHQVQGSLVSGHKIGGSVEGAIVLIPDPMGATGGTVVEAIDLYAQHGKALKYVALHCIITPEYIRKVRAKQPELVVYAVRLDRGLSPADVLKTVPGTFADRERGLNDRQYIVPGGGGFGEIMNNAFV